MENSGKCGNNIGDSLRSYSQCECSWLWDDETFTRERSQSIGNQENIADDSLILPRHLSLCDIYLWDIPLWVLFLWDILSIKLKNAIL